MNETFHVMQAIHSSSKLKKSPVPASYIYDYFNVRCFTSKPLSNNRSVIAHTVNCLIKALNECKKIPRFILIVPDWDILLGLQYFSYGIEEFVQKIIGWMDDKIKSAIEEKKDQFFKMKPGSITTTEPKLVWVKMLRRKRSNKKVLTVRGKYNDALEDILVQSKYHHIIDPNPKMSKAEYFSNANILTENGKTAYWIEIDDCIKMFEGNKLKLKPSKYKTDPPSDSASAVRYRLPPVPPKHTTVTPRSDKPHAHTNTQRQDNGRRHQSYNKVWLNPKFFK